MSRRARDAPIEYSLSDMFEKFSKYGDPKSDGKMICLSSSDKWMQQSGLIPIKFTLTETGISFYKFKTRSINYSDYEKFLQDLAKSKSIEYSEIVSKMTTCGLPGSNPVQNIMDLFKTVLEGWVNKYPCLKIGGVAKKIRIIFVVLVFFLGNIIR